MVGDTQAHRPVRIMHPASGEHVRLLRSINGIERLGAVIEFIALDPAAADVSQPGLLS
jgi:hypothetical protein